MQERGSTLDRCPALALPLTACGGFGKVIVDPPPPPPAVGAYLAPSIPERDGYVNSGGLFPGAYTTLEIKVGDGELWPNPDYRRRGFLSFDLSGLPANVEITSAELSVSQDDHSGAPYANLGGKIIVDHIVIGDELDLADYNSFPVKPNIGELSTNLVYEMKTLDVVDRVKNDIEMGRETSDYRLRFPVGLANNGVSDEVHFNGAENATGTGYLPKLIIKYEYK